MTPDPVQWLHAQLDKDDRIARTALAGRDGTWRYVETPGGDHRVLDSLGYSVVEDSPVESEPWFTLPHVAAHDPARVLREIDAKRRLLRAHGRPHECIALTGSGERSVVDGQPWELWEPEHTSDHGPCTTLRLLALPYEDRPGYREVTG